ncbi:MAG: hypothetical protein JWN40_3204 [Phycisphaerales bacterium]|nr:hypothetical protein [Phycisphaerales bacterium]
MTDQNDEFDFPKLGDALSAAYTHHAAIPTSVDDAMRAAATERFAQRRRMRLMARWGAGLAAGIAAAIVIMVSLHRPAPVAPLARGFDQQLTMIDALTLAKHLAAKESIDKSWDMNGDGVIDQKDVDAVATISVSLKPRVLGQHSLPTLQQLGIAHPVGLASASGMPAKPNTVSLAKSADKTEVPQ